MSAPMFNVSITRPAALPPKSTTSRMRPPNAVSSPGAEQRDAHWRDFEDEPSPELRDALGDELGPAEREN